MIGLDALAEGGEACASAPSGKKAVLGTAEGPLYLVDPRRLPARVLTTISRQEARRTPT